MPPCVSASLPDTGSNPSTRRGCGVHRRRCRRCCPAPGGGVRRRFFHRTHRTHRTHRRRGPVTGPQLEDAAAPPLRARLAPDSMVVVRRGPLLARPRPSRRAGSSRDGEHPDARRWWRCRVDLRCGSRRPPEVGASGTRPFNRDAPQILCALQVVRRRAGQPSMAPERRRRSTVPQVRRVPRPLTRRVSATLSSRPGMPVYPPG